MGLAPHHVKLIDYFASLCTFTAVLISGHQILKHLCNFNEASI